jgi:hypothetical protein
MRLYLYCCVNIILDIGDIIKVSIGQFYGIEINDFAVAVARTALWIAESQMMKETEDVIQMNLEFLPLKSFPNIVEVTHSDLIGRALYRRQSLTNIMGNPPFVGYSLQSSNQKDIFYQFILMKRVSLIKLPGKLTM